MFFAISAWRSHRLTGCLAALLLIAHSVTGSAAEEATTQHQADTAASDAERFCANVGDAARDARFAWEAKTLKDLKADIESATANLEAKRGELEEMLKRRDEFQKLAEKGMVDIYAKMPAEAAAAQLAVLDQRTAAAVLIKLNARAAGAILSQMDTPRAVSLAQLISSSGEPPKSGVSQQ
jgi:flagellar motility protein MotE (MotC chaperone)